MKEWRALAIIGVLLIITMITAPAYASPDTGTLSPSVTEYRILKGTDGNKLGSVTYTGSASTSVSWDYCNLTVTPAPPQSGLYVEVASKSCTRTGSGISVTIRLNIKGVYSGGNFNWNPLSTVKAALYKNGTVVDTIYFSVEPISIKEVTINKIDFDNPPIDTSTISYTVIPKTSVEAGTSIYIVTSADVNLVAELSDYLSVPTTVEVQYMLQSPSGGSSVWKTAYVTFGTDTLSASFTISDVPLTVPLPVQVSQNNVTIYSTSLDVPSKASEVNVGGAIISTAPPIQYWEREQSYKVVSQLYINQLQGGSVTISMTVNGKTVGPRTYTSTGSVDDLEVVFNDKQDTISGQYEIVYRGPYGSAPRVVVTFTSNYVGTTGGLLRDVFYILFMFIVTAGFTGVVMGLFLRRPDLQSSGMIMLSSGILIFLIPTLMGYAVALLSHTGIEDPVGVKNLNLWNLGDIVDNSIQYIQQKAYGYSQKLFGIAVFSVTILAVLAGIVTAGGIVGWLTAGALSEFLGQVLGALGSQILTLATLSFMASVFLKVLAIIFPITLNVIFTIILFTALLQALFAGFTGSHAQVYGTVISLSILILTVLLTPPILATLDKLISEQTIVIDLKVTQITIPDIFTALGLVVIQIVILTMILAVGFQRLMAVLSGSGAG